MSNVKSRVPAMIFLALAAFMAATRIHHFGPLPDASWGIFFAAGYYFGGRHNLAFAVLLAQAMLLDWLATRYMGVSAFCITPSYWAIVPGYAALWFGGHWLQRYMQNRPSDLLRLIGSATAAISLCFWITNGAFYWWGGRYPEPHLAEYLQRFALYLPSFLQTSLTYVAVISVVHLAVQQAYAWLLSRMNQAA